MRCMLVASLSEWKYREPACFQVTTSYVSHTLLRHLIFLIFLDICCGLGTFTYLNFFYKFYRSIGYKYLSKIEELFL